MRAFASSSGVILPRAQPVEHAEQLAHERGDLRVRGLAGDLEQRGVGERLDRGVDRVRETFLIGERIVQARRHAVVEHAQQRDQRDIRGIELGHRAKQDRERRLRAGVRHVLELRAGVTRRRRRHDRARRRRASRRAPCAARVDDGGVLDRPGDAQVRVPRAVERMRSGGGRRASPNRSTLLRGPMMRWPSGCVAEHQPARDVVGVDLDAGLVVVLVDLLEDQRALELDVVEARPREQFAEQRDGVADQLGLECELEQAVVAAGLGMERRAELLDGGVERERRRIALGTPKQHVLGEVRQPVVLGGLEPRADLDEHPAHRGVEVGQGDRGDRRGRCRGSSS